MGTLRAISPEPTGHAFNGVLLGEPVEIDGNPETWEWDDSAFPNGVIEIVDGEVTVIPDEVEA